MIFVRARRGHKARAASWGIKQTPYARRPFRPAWMKRRPPAWALSMKDMMQPISAVVEALRATMGRLDRMEGKS